MSRQHEAQGVGLVLELEAVDVAEVVAVDLVRHGAVGDEVHGLDVGAVVDVLRLAEALAAPSAEAAMFRNGRTFIVRTVTTTRPRSSVASGARLNGRLPRNVYGFVLSTTVM